MEKSKNSNTNNEVPLTFLFTDSSVLLSVFQRGNWSQGVPDAALLWSEAWAIWIFYEPSLNFFIRYT